VNVLDFQGLLQLLVRELQQRVRCGEVTERSLARVTGVSQPHLHHVLHGQRLLSIAMADRILHRLHLDLRELIESDEPEK
jgi:transcriptional regulator with XRE-family HTH domain